ncbi:MAG: glycosyltransferase family 4 protein [Chthonomonadales bacterium]
MKLAGGVGPGSGGRVGAEGFDADAPKPTLCLIGPMLGRNPGWVTTPGEILTDLFRNLGYPVISVSSIPNRLLRLADIVRTLVRRHRNIHLAMLQVYSGPSFVVEDIASRICSWFRIPVVMVLHGGAMPAFMAKYPQWTTRVLSRAEVLVAPSAYLARPMRERGMPVQVIPNLIELQNYPFRVRSCLKPRLLWMRTFHPIYNPAMAIRAFAQVKRRHPDATLVMAGQEKGLGAAVRKMVHELGLDDAVRFPGFLDGPAKAREGNAADIFLNTNHIDNMPVSVLEACAMGLPVVATAVGGVPDLLTDGSTGLLVSDDDWAAMAEAVERLLTDEALAERLSRNGRRLAEASAWDHVRPQWEKLIRTFAKVPGASVKEGG